jgi:Sad1 / UNC-like C-terminal.
MMKLRTCVVNIQCSCPKSGHTFLPRGLIEGTVTAEVLSSRKLRESSPEAGIEPVTYIPTLSLILNIVLQMVADTFDMVELKILSNHGNIEYTCLYRFRVHGNLAPSPSPVHTYNRFSSANHNTLHHMTSSKYNPV